MATEVNQNFFAWSQEETSVQDLSQGTSQMFGHGSISFGRFDLESLEWEKWSVFTNDRRHEEFGKFNGLVAKKKAYFEEYFKRIRELKALQQQNQQTELHLEYNGDGSDSSQTGEYEAATAHRAPIESETLIDASTKQTTAATTIEHGMNGSSVNEISASTHSSPVGDLQQIGKQMRGSVDGKMDILEQDANSSQDDPMVHDIMITPNKRTIGKDSRVGQVSKIIPKTVKMTSSNVSDHRNVSKGPCSGKPSVINQMANSGNTLSLRRPREATSDLGGTAAISGITGLRRPSSAALQRPSTRERRPFTKDASRKHAEVTTPCRPSTSERRMSVRDTALKHDNNTIPCRPSTAHRRPIAKESPTKQCNIATPSRPSTADRRSVTQGSTPKLSNIATPSRPSTADRRPVTQGSTPKLSNIAAPHRPSTSHRRPISKESAPKHFNVASPHRPSTGQRHTTSYLPSVVKQCPITGEGTHKHADIVTLNRSSTADKHLIVRDVAPKYATSALPRRPSTAERRPIARDVAPKDGLPNRPSTAERRPIARDVAPKNGLPHRPSTAERRPIARDVAPKNGVPHRPSTAERRPIVRNVEPKHPPAQRPSTAERRPVTRETVLKQTNVANSRLPLTPDRCLTKKSVISTPERPSTGGRCPITNGTTVWSRAMPNYSKGAMVTEVTPQKAITPRVVRSSKLENLSYAKETVELQVDRKQKSSPFNLPSRKMLTSNVRDDQGLEKFKKPDKKGLQEGVRVHAYKSNNLSPSQTGNVKTKAPVPPPPPPPLLPGRQYCTEKKLNINSSPVGVRKPKASAPHWH